MGHEHIRPTRKVAWCIKVPTGTAKTEIPASEAATPGNHAWAQRWYPLWPVMGSPTPSLPQVVLKLSALHKDLIQFLTSNPESSYSASRIAHYFDRYASLSAALGSALPALFGDLPDRVREPDPHGRVAPYVLKDLIREMDYCADILSRLNLDEHGIALRVTREGAFFAGQQFDAVRQLQEIINTAQREIILIDGYSNEKTLDLLTVKGRTASAHLLTKPKSITPAFRAAANAFNQQFGGLSVRASDSYHDRFLFIDSAEFFHFGASLNDAGKRAFMFSRIEEPTVVTAILTQWTSEWAAAQIVV